MKGQNITAKMTKQIQRIEIQRDRLLEDLEEVETLNEKIKLERFISDIDNRLIQLYSKMIQSGKTSLESTVKIEEITDDEIKEFVRELINSGASHYSDGVYSENNIQFHFIKKKQCNISYAERVFEKMKDYGLDLCMQRKPMVNYFATLSQDFSQTYNLEKFALLRSYITLEEIGNITKERMEIKAEIEKEEKERKQKFVEKYGDDQSRWPQKVQEMYDLGEEIE